MKPGKEMPIEDEWPRGSLGEEVDALCQQQIQPPTVPDATGFSGQTSQRSWVIWLKDGRYSYAWGETQADAWANWLKGFGEAVIRIVPAGEYKSALPVGHYLREMNGQI